MLSSTRSSRFIEDSSALTLSVMPPKYGRSSQRQRAADARIRAHDTLAAAGVSLPPGMQTLFP